MKTMACGTWVSLMVALLFLMASSPTDACTCLAVHLQSDFCNSGIILKGKFLSATRHEYSENSWDNGPSSFIAYGMEIQEVVKGPKRIQNLEFISFMYLCPFDLHSSQFNIEYVITGHMENGQVVLGLCNYIEPWSQLSAGQIQGIQGAYSAGCSCEIVDYYNAYGNTSNRCIFKENGSDGLDQEKNQMCVPEENGGCAWKTIAS